MTHVISKETLLQFYDQHWDDMEPFIIGHYLSGFNAHGIYQRNDNGKPIIVSSKEEFLAIVKQKYLTQVIPELGLISNVDADMTNILLIDMDSPFPMEKNKEYIGECFKLASKNIPKELKPKLLMIFTGGKSYHLRITINKEMEWDAAKQLLEETIIAPFYKKYGDAVTFPPTTRMPPKEAKLTRLHLDMSSMKRRGAARCAYSFYKDTPYFAVPIHSLAELAEFTMVDATFTVVSTPIGKVHVKA